MALNNPRINWVSDDLTIYSGAVDRYTSSAVTASGVRLGTLTNSGTISSFDGILRPNIPNGTIDQIINTHTGLIEGSSTADVAGETSFSSNGPSTINDTGVLNFGLTLVRSDCLSVAARYTLEAGSGYTANPGNLQARWNF